MIANDSVAVRLLTIADGEAQPGYRPGDETLAEC